MKVQLTSIDVIICQMIGRMRNIVNKTCGIKDTKISPDTNDNIDVQGFLAEYAFCKHFNLFPDFDVTPRSGSYDAFYKGYRYDIKSTQHKNGRLIATTKVNPDVDIYILAIIDDTEIDFIGYAFKEELIRPENITNLGYGDTYLLERNKLHKFKDGHTTEISGISGRKQTNLF